MSERNRPYPEGICWDEAWRQRERANRLEEACEAVLASLEKLASDGEIIWIDPPYVMSGVHESAIERLKSVIEQRLEISSVDSPLTAAETLVD